MFKVCISRAPSNESHESRCIIDEPYASPMSKSMWPGVEAVQHHKQFKLCYFAIARLPQSIYLWGDVCDECLALPGSSASQAAMNLGCCKGRTYRWRHGFKEMMASSTSKLCRIAGVNSPVRSCCRALMAERPPHPTRPQTPISKKFATP